MINNTYKTDGYELVRNILTENEVLESKSHAHFLAKKAENLDKSSRIHNTYFELQSKSGRKDDPEIYQGVLRKITNPSNSSLFFKNLKNHPNFLKQMKIFGLKNPICAVDQINFKAAKIGSPFPFHQDAHFLKHEAYNKLVRYGGINFVIALEETTLENGAFIIVKDSHHQKLTKNIKGYDTSKLRSSNFDHDEMKELPLLQRPGDAVFFDPWLAHGSGPNRSESSRILLTFWFVDQE